MRLIKMLGIAAMMAFALTAFVGSSAASAKVVKAVLCKANEKLCSAANLWGEHVTILALSTKAVLLGSLPVTCHSHTTVLAEKSDSDRILGKITSLTWSNCSGCTEVTSTTLPSGALFPGATPANATLTTSSTTVVLLKGCPFGIECTATATTASLTLTGGTINGTAQAAANKVPVVLSGNPLCGTKGEWDAGSEGSSPYVVTEVTPKGGAGAKSGSIFFSKESHA